MKSNPFEYAHLHTTKDVIVMPRRMFDGDGLVVSDNAHKALEVLSA